MITRGVVLSLVASGSLLCADAAGQPLTNRLEIGAHVNLLHQADAETTSAGIGGRVSFDLSNWAALEAEADFFPSDDLLLAPSSLTPTLRVAYERRRADAFAGVKLGMRTDAFGIFAKVRPGVTRLTDRGGAECLGSECPLVLLARPDYRTEFALDLGGVVELYPSVRTVARVELSDTLIRHRSLAPPCWAERCTSHNLSTRLGVGLRF
jgi:hypothetical protein